MQTKFYMVNDYKDLFSGKILPHKVLDYMPLGTMGPFMQPMPIKKTQELVISPDMSPTFPILSPMSPSF